MEIDNNYPCFVQLWRELERTRLQLMSEHRMFCIRRVMQRWFPDGFQPEHPTHLPREYLRLDEALFWVCLKSKHLGYETLPDPNVDPAPCRDFLRALVSVYLNIGMQSVSVAKMDRARGASIILKSF